jgi:hypothetical protein
VAKVIDAKPVQYGIEHGIILAGFMTRPDETVFVEHALPELPRVGA